VLFKSFLDIKAWQEARLLVKDIYLMCNQGESKQTYLSNPTNPENDRWLNPLPERKDNR